MRKREEKGITLIALIITIIVMLILVAVTVGVALNGGLFKTAKDAAKGTLVEADRETLQAGIIGALNETLEIPNAMTLQDNLPNGWTVEGEGPYECISQNNNKFKVLKDGTIKGVPAGDLELLEEYCLGKVYTEIFNSNYPYKFINNDVIPTAEKDLIYLKELVENAHKFFYAKYNNKVYKISVEMKDNICRNVELIYEPKGREGQTVQYDSNNDGYKENWMILYDNGDNVEIISDNNMGNLTLGYNDTEARTPGDVDKDGKENTNTDKAIYSYNNVIERLNNYCASLVTNENKISVRSMGSNPDNPSSENTTLYTSEKLANWADGKYNGIVKSADMNFEQDWIRMTYYGCYLGSPLCIASRIVRESSSDIIAFGIRSFDTTDYMDYTSLFSVKEKSGITADSPSLTVRPVVKISSDQI